MKLGDLRMHLLGDGWFKSTYAAFTLGWNMLALIMNETCFTVLSVHNALHESWSKHVYSDHDWKVRQNMLNRVAKNGEETSAWKILNWGYNETQYLFHILADDEIHGQLLVIMQNPASPCKRTKDPIRQPLLTTELVENRIFFTKDCTNSLVAMIWTALSL